MLKVMPIATAIMPQWIYIFYYFFSIVRLCINFYQLAILCMLQSSHIESVMLNIILTRKLVSHFAPAWHDYYAYVYYVTFDDLTKTEWSICQKIRLLLDYTDRFVVTFHSWVNIKLNPSYKADIMLNAFN